MGWLLFLREASVGRIVGGNVVVLPLVETVVVVVVAVGVFERHGLQIWACKHMEPRWGNC